MLHTELPWATSLAAEPVDTRTAPPDFDPVLMHTARLNNELLTPEASDALQQRERISAVNSAAHQRHLTATRKRQHARDRGFEHDRDGGIEI